MGKAARDGISPDTSPARCLMISGAPECTATTWWEVALPSWVVRQARGSSPFRRSILWPVRLGVRMSGSQPGGIGSNPIRATITEIRMSLREEFPEYDLPPLEMGDGWIGVVRRLLERCREANIVMSVHQVKEKFGGLRFYAAVLDDSSLDVFYSIVREAEAEAETTCEKCGRPGSLRSDRPWIRTLCDEHAS